jgi:hypothetical protein
VKAAAPLLVRFWYPVNNFGCPSETPIPAQCSVFLLHSALSPKLRRQHMKRSCHPPLYPLASACTNNFAPLVTDPMLKATDPRLRHSKWRQRI